MSIFIDRAVELNVLEERYGRKQAEFLMVYGRRRVGKTEVIKQFSKDKLHVYYLCTKENDVEQMKKIARRVAQALGERPLELNNWEEFFEYVTEKTQKNKLVLTIDEYPYLLSANKAISSIFQAGWDEHLKNSRVFLILCGSSVSVMETELSSKSPLYGRRTGQMRIEPLPFLETVKFFPKYNMENKIYGYSILGNIPMYLLEFSDEKDIFQNISDSILKKDAILYEEPIFLLREELREPDTYSRILEAISPRGARLNDVATKCGLVQHKLPKYMGVLLKLNYVEKITPVTTKKPGSKQTFYRLKDNFFKFWYKFVYPNKSEIEGGDVVKVMEIIRNGLGQYTSFVFEDVCAEVLKELNRQNKLPLKFSKIGPWWGKSSDGNEEVELDLVALDERKKCALFVQCKWSDLKQNEAFQILEELKRNSNAVEFKRETEHFCLFARKIGGKIELKQQGYLVFDLEDFDELAK